MCEPLADTTDPGEIVVWEWRNGIDLANRRELADPLNERRTKGGGQRFRGRTQDFNALLPPVLNWQLTHLFHSIQRDTV